MTMKMMTTKKRKSSDNSQDAVNAEECLVENNLPKQ